MQIAASSNFLVYGKRSSGHSTVRWTRFPAETAADDILASARVRASGTRARSCKGIPRSRQTRLPSESFCNHGFITPGMAGAKLPTSGGRNRRTPCGERDQAIGGIHRPIRNVLSSEFTAARARNSSSVFGGETRQRRRVDRCCSVDRIARMRRIWHLPQTPPKIRKYDGNHVSALSAPAT